MRSGHRRGSSVSLIPLLPHLLANTGRYQARFRRWACLHSCPERIILGNLVDVTEGVSTFCYTCQSFYCFIMGKCLNDFLGTL
jgi:hypothetical protein